MTRQSIESMSLEQIAELLERDGYDDLIAQAGAIRLAARQGSLLWTRDRLVASMPSRSIETDARPER